MSVGVKNYLLSYFDWPRDVADRILREPACNLLVDSGAFSAWNSAKSVVIDIEEYADHLESVRDSAPQCGLRFVNLDVIPGKRGRWVTTAQRRDSASGSWDNFVYLRKRGIDVMPVFHQYESFDWLTKMAAASDYIGVSPSNDETSFGKSNWLFKVLRRIGVRVRTHGFGVASAQVLKEFPYYSSDASTWMNSKKYKNLVTFASKLRYVRQISKESVQHLIRRDEELRALLPLLKEVNWTSEEAVNWLIDRGLSSFIQLEDEVTEHWSQLGLVWPQSFREDTGSGALIHGREHQQIIFQGTVEPASELVNITLGLIPKRNRSGLTTMGRTKVSRFEERLQELKGARLSVWIAYSLKAKSNGAAQLCTDELKELTGLDYKAIEDARPWLRRKGWLVRMKELKILADSNSGEENQIKLIVHPDQRRGETAGVPDWHAPEIPMSEPQSRSSRNRRSRNQGT